MRVLIPSVGLSLCRWWLRPVESQIELVKAVLAARSSHVESGIHLFCMLGTMFVFSHRVGAHTCSTYCSTAGGYAVFLNNKKGGQIRKRAHDKIR